MDRHRDVEQIFGYTAPTPSTPGEFAQFVQLFQDRETGELILTTRAADLRFVSIEIPTANAHELGRALLHPQAHKALAS